MASSAVRYVGHTFVRRYRASGTGPGECRRCDRTVGVSRIKNFKNNVSNRNDLTALGQGFSGFFFSFEGFPGLSSTIANPGRDSVKMPERNSSFSHNEWGWTHETQLQRIEAPEDNSSFYDALDVLFL